MSFEAIGAITKAETDAKNTVLNAEAEARQMIADAEKAGREQLEAAEAKAAEEIEIMRRQAEEKAANRAAALFAQTDTEKAALREKALSRLDGAAAFIVERIVKG